MKKNICKFKYENLIFIAMVMGFIYGATTRQLELNNFITVVIQIAMAEFLRLGLRFVRRNPEQFKKEILLMIEE